MIYRDHGPLFASREAATRAAPRAPGDRLRILRALAEHDDSWKARCRIVQRENEYWDITSFDDRWWWSARLDCWLPTWGAPTRIGIYETADKARRTLADCTMPPPVEERR